MKKILIILFIGLLLISCGKKAKAPTDVIQVRFWNSMGGPLGEALMFLVNEFNETHPGIFINAINMGNYTALSQKLMASLQTGNQPDIAQVFESWTANMIDGDVIVPIEDFIKNDPDFTEEKLADIYPVFIQSNTVNGKLVTFPFNKSVRVLYYNKDIFFQNGIDRNKPPKTWDSFLEYCRKLTIDADHNGVNELYGTTLKISAWQFENLLLQAGGEIMSADEKEALFNSKEGVVALEFLTQLLNEDKTAYLSPGYEGQNDFLAGKVAMYEDSSVSVAYMIKAGIDFNIGITSIPIEKTKRNVISGTNIAIFKSDDEKVQNAAWEFIKWFTDTKQTAKWSELTYYMPVRKSAFEVAELKSRLASNPEIAAVYDQLNYASFEPQMSEWFETRKYLEEHVIEKVVRGILSPQKALNNAAEMIEKKIKDRKK